MKGIDAIRIDISTHDYEWSHGKRPRGRGTWWFEISVTTPGFGAFNNSRKEWSGTGLYSVVAGEARKVARQMARNLGSCEARVRVMS